jgi:hypothetical protein
LMKHESPHASNNVKTALHGAMRQTIRIPNFAPNFIEIKCLSVHSAPRLEGRRKYKIYGSTLIMGRKNSGAIYVAQVRVRVLYPIRCGCGDTEIFKILGYGYSYYIINLFIK